MVRPSILLAFVVTVGFGQSAQPRYTTVDSLVDVFPLAIGNEWTYAYSYRFEDLPGVIFSYLDTGYVNLRVINKVMTSDSIRWLIREIGNHWTQTNGQAWIGPQTRTDTFEVFEFTAGNHWMYRTGNVTDVRKSIFPFLINLADTGKVLRYAHVDSAGLRRFRTEEVPRGVFFTFWFAKGVGLTSVFMMNGITGWPNYSTRHSLRSSIITAVPESSSTTPPEGYCLEQNYPNPFNPTTMISFSLPSNYRVRVSVVDLLGREVDILLDEERSMGSHTLKYDASDLASGVYFYRLQAGAFMQVKKMVITK